MNFVCPLPPIKVLVRPEYLYDFQCDVDAPLVEGIWCSVKASIEEQQQPSPFEVFVMHMLHAATNAHILHWTRKGAGSYAAHQALGAFYEELPDLLDVFIEAFQGKYGLLTDFVADYKLPGNNPLEYMKMLQTEVATLRRATGFPQDSELQNEVDTIANLINSTVYKLENLQ